jgi:hypothetical protein
VLKNVNLGGHRHLIIDVALNHEFGGNHMAGVSRNGALRAADPARLLEATARTEIGFQVSLGSVFLAHSRSLATVRPVRSPSAKR